jgi:hypothetical protein
MFYSAIPSRAWARFCPAIMAKILSTLGLSHIHGGEWGAASSSRSYLQYNVLLQDLGAGSLLAGSCQEHLSNENKRTKLRANLCPLFTIDQDKVALHQLFSQHTATSFLVFLKKDDRASRRRPFRFMLFLESGCSCNHKLGLRGKARRKGPEAS